MKEKENSRTKRSATILNVKKLEVRSGTGLLLFLL